MLPRITFFVALSLGLHLALGLVAESAGPYARQDQRAANKIRATILDPGKAFSLRHEKLAERPRPAGHVPRAVEPPRANNEPVSGDFEATDPPGYLSPSEVDQVASLPATPPELPFDDLQDQGGFLQIRLLVSATGNVDDIEVLASSLPDAAVIRLTELLRQLTLTPATKSDVTVPSWKEIEIVVEPGQQPPQTNPALR